MPPGDHDAGQWRNQRNEKPKLNEQCFPVAEAPALPRLAETRIQEPRHHIEHVEIHGDEHVQVANERTRPENDDDPDGGNLAGKSVCERLLLRMKEMAPDDQAKEAEVHAQEGMTRGGHVDHGVEIWLWEKKFEEGEEIEGEDRHEVRPNEIAQPAQAQIGSHAQTDADERPDGGLAGETGGCLVMGEQGGEGQTGQRHPSARHCRWRQGMFEAESRFRFRRVGRMARWSGNAMLGRAELHGDKGANEWLLGFQTRHVTRRSSASVNRRP